MWTCPKCLTENGDRSAACENCGAPRTGRRFSPPSVQNAPYPPQQSGQHFRSEAVRVPRAAARVNRPGELMLPPLSRAAKLARVVGTLLCLLLPLLCLLLCWKQYEALYAALVPLLTGSAEKTVMGHLCYVLYALCALLLSLTPGLSMLSSTGKYKKHAAREDKRLL